MRNMIMELLIKLEACWPVKLFECVWMNNLLDGLMTQIERISSFRMPATEKKEFPNDHIYFCGYRRNHVCAIMTNEKWKSTYFFSFFLHHWTINISPSLQHIPCMFHSRWLTFLITGTNDKQFDDWGLLLKQLCDAYQLHCSVHQLPNINPHATKNWQFFFLQFNISLFIGSH